MMWLCWFHCDLQYALGWFAAKCEAVGMKVSTSKTEAMVLCRKKANCSLWFGSELLLQTEEFKYLWVLFTSEGRMKRELDRQIGAASAVMQALHRIILKKKLSRKVKLSIYQSIYVPALTYGHELWLVTERMRWRIQAAEMSFLCRVAGFSLRDRMRSSDIQRKLGVKPLLHCSRRKEPVEVVRASDQDASWAPSFGGVPGMSNWQETPG